MIYKMLKQVCQLAREAGSLIMKFYSSEESIKVSYKKDYTPITNVDFQAHNLIKKGLLFITPEIPILSEEDVHNLKKYKYWNSYWLIDPLDGTKEFLKKNGEFTVNISLIENGIPILGVIYAPFFDILYSSFNKKAWKETKIGLKKEIHISYSKIPLVVTSRSHPDQELNNYLRTMKFYNIKKMGSSLKFCYIAEGRAQIYPRFGNTCIWDTAAGHAILIAAGGNIKTWTGTDLNYLLSSRSSLFNPGFCASSL